MKIEGKKLPTRLTKQPIVDAVAEIRFSTTVDVALILPGFLLRHFPSAQISRLPAADMPNALRQSDENLKYQPLLRIVYENFFFLVGSTTLAVGCALPYPGWSSFFAMIRKVVDIASETQLMTEVSRYSLKYSDVIECDDAGAALKYLDIDVRVAEKSVGDGGLNINFMSAGGRCIHLVQVAVIANLELIDGTRKKGALISVDSISTGPAISMSVFSAEVDNLFSVMHEENKSKFFSCLKEETLEHLGAEYV